MPGVAGRSQGCGTCKRRHLKCDKTRPICQRCQKAGFECEGAQDRAFVSFHAGEAGLQRLHAGTTARGQSLVKPDPNSPPVPTTLLHNVSWPSDSLCIAYARKHLPKHWAEKSYWQQLSDINDAKDASLEPQLVSQTLLCLAKTLFGFRHQQKHLYNEGLRLYTRLVSTVRDCLSNSDIARRLDVFEAILAFRAFDSFIPASREAWIQHSFGLESLILLRGSAACQDIASRDMIEHARFLIVMACLPQRRRTPLAQTEWLLPSLEGQNTHQRYYTELMNIFVKLTDINYAQQNTGSTDELREQARQMIRQLHSWRKNWELEFPVIHLDCKNDYPDDVVIDPLWPSGLWFTTRDQAKMILMFNAICIVTVVMGFRYEITTMHRALQCPGDLYACSKSITELESPDQDILLFYHATLFESCRSISHYFRIVREDDHPIDLRVPYRLIWLYTHNIPCHLSRWFDRMMHEVARHPADGVPFVLWQLPTDRLASRAAANTVLKGGE